MKEGECKFIEAYIDAGFLEPVLGWICTECEAHYEQDKMDFNVPNYCPNCGCAIKKKVNDE